MRLIIERTEQFTRLDGVEVRIWEGTTESCIPCLVFVHRIAVHDSFDKSEFDQELATRPGPEEWPGDLKAYLDTRPTAPGENNAERDTITRT